VLEIIRAMTVVQSCCEEDSRPQPIPISVPSYASFGVTATGSWANGQPLDTTAKMAAPPLREPQRAPGSMKSPTERGWKLGDTEAPREERQLGRHVDLLTIKAFSWKLPAEAGRLPSLSRRPAGQAPHPMAQPAGSASASCQADILFRAGVRSSLDLIPEDAELRP
jgi:hypothetical protein